MVLQLNADFAEAKDEDRGNEHATYDTSSEDESIAPSSEGDSDTGSDIVDAHKVTQRHKSEKEGPNKRKAAEGTAAKRRKTSAGKQNIFHFVQCVSCPLCLRDR